jgi:hypothetical protein
LNFQQTADERKQKGCRYIMSNQGPSEPAQNTQAAPVLPEGNTSTDFVMRF